VKWSIRSILCLSLVLAASGCSSSSSISGTAGRLAAPGPYHVGVTSLGLGNAGALGQRQVTVFYPADPSKLSGHQQFRYQLADSVPQALSALIPAKYNSTISVDAYVGAPGSRSGPFPVVLFSHGFGATRLFYSHLLRGIASWGFVVVSADYLERGLLAQATHSSVPDTPALDLQVMFESLDVVELGSADLSSPLYRLVDEHKVATLGHSAGGQTAFDALADPRIATAVGWAPVGPSQAVPRKPVTIIGEQGDIALTPATLTKEFHHFSGATTLVEISGTGHNSYTDICPSIRNGGGGLVGFAISLHLISQELARLATNGCTAKDQSPQSFWPIVQYNTLVALRSGLGISSAVNVTESEAHQFPHFTITVVHHS
jgi:dienelactone hydrolase